MTIPAVGMLLASTAVAGCTSTRASRSPPSEASTARRIGGKTSQFVATRSEPTQAAPRVTASSRSTRAWSKMLAAVNAQTAQQMSKASGNTVPRPASGLFSQTWICTQLGQWSGRHRLCWPPGKLLQPDEPCAKDRQPDKQATQPELALRPLGARLAARAQPALRTPGERDDNSAGNEWMCRGLVNASQKHHFATVEQRVDNHGEHEIAGQEVAQPERQARDRHFLQRGWQEPHIGPAKRREGRNMQQRKDGRGGE